MQAAMQADYAERFERDMGCTEAEWLGWLPAAIGVWPWRREGRQVQVTVDGGLLQIDWQAGASRSIGLVRIPRLLVCFAFEGLDPAQRYAFMKRFDLYMQRGGG
jgi:hypothetical protein